MIINPIYMNIILGLYLSKTCLSGDLGPAHICLDFPGRRLFSGHQTAWSHPWLFSWPGRFLGSHPVILRAAQNFSYRSDPTSAIIPACTLFSPDCDFLKDESCEFFSPALTIVGFENRSHNGTQTEKTTISPSLPLPCFFPPAFMGNVLESILQIKQIEGSRKTLGYTSRYTCYKCVCKRAFTWQVSQKGKSDHWQKTPISICYWGGPILPWVQPDSEVETPAIYWRFQKSKPPCKR